MKLVIDVQYDGTNAVVAGVIFSDWASNAIHETILTPVSNVKPYQAGAFYKRELPCILKLLEKITLSLEVIIIDGFVVLGDDNADGLGMHLYNALDQKIPIIGVAKKAFINTPVDYKIYRGGSKKPLYVTATGINISEAKASISTMHGKHRIPSLLKKVDQLCRGINTSQIL
ncbi:MAG: endonuclease V [Methylococcales bacterium]|nr:endonuclease V [Methylococcales bacterium]MCK5926130.1 endonuclease V [Methylococcales bacterium]